MVAQNYVIVIIYYTYINSVKYRKLYCDMKLYVLIRRSGATRQNFGTNQYVANINYVDGSEHGYARRAGFDEF